MAAKKEVIDVVPGHVTGPDYPGIHKFAAFHGWAVQYVIFCKENESMREVDQKMELIQKDLDAKLDRQQSLLNIVDTFKNDGYITAFAKEIEEDKERIAKLE